MTRRDFLSTASAAVIAAGLASGSSSAAFAQAAERENVPADELAVPGPLGDIALGSNDAKVTIYEYASMTCPHCAEFHEKTFPVLKEKYIDTGKVRFIFREFPIDPLATAAFMLARCSGEAGYHPLVTHLFANQRQWAVRSPNVVETLFNAVKQAGFTQEKFEACLKDQKVYEGVLAVRERAEKVLGVQATPTFFINGKLHRGSFSVTEMDTILGPLVGG